MASPPRHKTGAEETALRIRNLAILLLVGLGILAARLAYLQVIHGEAYARLADSNRLYLQRLQAPRGKIFGRNENVVLADNRAAWDIVVVPKECRDPEEVCRRLEQLINIDGDALLKRIESAMRSQPYMQIDVKRDVTWGDLVRVEELSGILPGVLTVVRPQRRYVHGKVAGQLLGYLGELNREQFERLRPEYKLGDLMGQAGLERMHESTLRGRDGELWVNVYASSRPQLRTDAYGNPYVHADTYGRTLAEETQWRRDPVPGDSIYLTLDIELQAFAEGLLEGLQGAITVLNADTGEVLALASAPGYDPSIFVQAGYSDARLRALTSDSKPMRNRCFQEHHPPGSIFKIVVAIAALEEGKVTPDSTFYCPGHYQLSSGHRKRCWRTPGHGSLALADSLAYSCNVYYYNAGLELGVDRIHDWAVKLGYGAPTGLGLGEIAGVVPSRAWKEREFASAEPWDRRWYAAETLDFSIGQGYLSITPLQAAVMIAAVTNGGRRVTPYIHANAAPEVSEPLFGAETLKPVREGLIKCVEKETFPSGTGRRAKVPGIVVMGKTGTVQVASAAHLEQYEEDEDVPEHLRSHAWFVAGCPYEDPPIAMSILVEHGLQGSAAAAPLAREVIEFFYGRELDPILLAQEGDRESSAG